VLLLDLFRNKRLAASLGFREVLADHLLRGPPLQRSILRPKGLSILLLGSVVYTGNEYKILYK